MKMKYSCSHNEAEYEACILGLKVALSMGVTKASVFGDSLLIIYQTNGTKDEKFIPYLASLADGNRSSPFGEPLPLSTLSSPFTRAPSWITRSLQEAGNYAPISQAFASK